MLAALVSLPLMGRLASELEREEAEAKERRRRRKARHKRRHKPGKHKGKGNKKNKRKDAPQECIPDSTAQTCQGKCGQITNNCQQPVNCGACGCEPVCGACFTCQTGQNAPGQCVIDPARQGMACGLPGQICQTDGACACTASSCPGESICQGGACCLPDSADLQTAIDATAANGALTLCAGDWDLASTANVSKNLTLVGAGAAQTILDGGGAVRVLLVAASTLLRVEALTVRNGRASFGAGIFSDGAVVLRDAVLTGNVADNQGGGVYSNGNITLEAGSRVTGNSAIEGGGLRNNNSTVTLKAGSVVGGDTPQEANQAVVGGGIGSTGTVILESGSRVAGNIATIAGGGIYMNGSTTLQAGSEVTGNSSGGEGGGIHCDSFQLTVKAGSRVSDNTALSGGGISTYLQCTATVESGGLVCDNGPTDGQCGGNGAFSGDCPSPVNGICPA